MPCAVSWRLYSGDVLAVDFSGYLLSFFGLLQDDDDLLVSKLIFFALPKPRRGSHSI
jgi:hypothetical protein